MVIISGFLTKEKEDGTTFNLLVVQGGLEAVKSQKTGKMYFTAKEAKVACTFDEAICKTLIGTEFPGSVEKVDCDPYEYIVKETGELIKLSHRYEYLSEEEVILSKNVVSKDLVV